MKKLVQKYYSIFILLCILIYHPISLHGTKNRNSYKNVLLIESYNDNFLWSRNIVNGITDCFAKSKINIRFSIEHLDQRLHSETYTFDQIAERIKEKYKDERFDIIITSDNPSFNFIKRYRDSLFLDLPVVFCGYNNLNPVDLIGMDQITGINEQINIEHMVHLVETIHPNLKNLIFITSTKDLHFKELSLLCDQYIYAKRSNIKIFNLVDISHDEFKERLRTFHKESAVIVFGLLNDELTQTENSKAIASISPFPVYTNWDFPSGTNIVGGIIINGYDQGYRAAELVLQIFSGKKAEELPIIMETPVKKMFDYNNLNRFNIPLSKLPENSILLNEPQGLFYTHKPLFIGFIFTILSFLIILIILILINTQKRLLKKNYLIKENQLARISNNLVNGFIFQIDTGIDGKLRKFTFVSDSVLHFLGFTPKQLYEDSSLLYNMIHPEDAQNHTELENEAIHKNTMLMMVGRIITKEGEVKHFQSTSIPHKDDNGHLLFDGIIVDISKLKKTEEDLLHAKIKAEESNRLITAFLTNLSHEVRTPMNGIVAFIDIVNNINIKPSEKTIVLENFQESSNRFLKTLDDIILMSEIQSSKIPVHRTTVDINQLMNNIFDQFINISIEKSLSFSWNKDYYLQNCYLETDSEKLEIILANLIENAIKYTDKGYVEYGYKIEKNWIQFFVKDSGLGISKENFAIIFDRFVQANMGNNRPFEGSGLGLSIAKSYVEMLEGEIWLESQEFEGSQFFFKFRHHYSNSDISNSN
ncbi:MAG TPA: ABC transporter substrate binding protein [Bacteroidales bacterium]|nr:ABC transporter substrate binding protein [Bacteroidales bacterium]